MPRRSRPAFAGAFDREVARVFLRARFVLLAGALLSAVAADLVYGLAALAVSRWTAWSIYFPPFFLVALAAFAALALRSAGRLTLSRRLDAEFGLKERLASAEMFRTDPRVPAAVVGAQAREALAAVDFPALRRRFSFRPWRHLAVIGVFGGITVMLAWRTNGFLPPGNFPFGPGPGTGGTVAVDGRGSPAPGAAGTGSVPVKPPGVSPGAARTGVDVPPGREGRPGATAADRGTGGEAAGGKPDASAARPPGKPAPPPPERTAAAKPPAGRQDAGRAAPGGEGGTLRKSTSTEVTARPSPLAAKPRTGIFPADFAETAPGGRGSLPPIPLLRLLAGERRRAGIVDPDAVTIVPEAYAPAYRDHIVAYFTRLLAMREARDGS